MRFPGRAVRVAFVRRRRSTSSLERVVPRFFGIGLGESLWRERRAALVGLLLLLTLFPAAYLAWQAVKAAGSHEETAQSVVHDYAAIAAKEFSTRA